MLRSNIVRCSILLVMFCRTNSGKLGVLESDFSTREYLTRDGKVEVPTLKNFNKYGGSPSIGHLCEAIEVELATVTANRLSLKMNAVAFWILAVLAPRCLKNLDGFFGKSKNCKAMFCCSFLPTSQTESTVVAVCCQLSSWLRTYPIEHLLYTLFLVHRPCPWVCYTVGNWSLRRTDWCAHYGGNSKEKFTAAPGNRLKSIKESSLSGVSATRDDASDL